VFSLWSLLPEFDMTGFVRERSGASLPASYRRTLHDR